jgi:hypothetical protein
MIQVNAFPLLGTGYGFSGTELFNSEYIINTLIIIMIGISQYILLLLSIYYYRLEITTLSFNYLKHI